jgi:hypothetical protein
MINSLTLSHVALHLASSFASHPCVPDTLENSLCAPYRRVQQPVRYSNVVMFPAWDGSRERRPMRSASRCSGDVRICEAGTEIANSSARDERWIRVWFDRVASSSCRNVLESDQIRKNDGTDVPSSKRRESRQSCRTPIHHTPLS